MNKRRGRPTRALVTTAAVLYTPVTITKAIGHTTNNTYHGLKQHMYASLEEREVRREAERLQREAVENARSVSIDLTMEDHEPVTIKMREQDVLKMAQARDESRLLMKFYKSAISCPFCQSGENLDAMCDTHKAYYETLTTTSKVIAGFAPPMWVSA